NIYLIERCTLPTSNRGLCGGRLERWTYSPYHNFCFFFIYGGCGARENIFNTRAECYSACVRSF
ncbi:hypothetical protein KR200_000102, partial [Drosophila serrata]